jgi:ribosomal protein S20
MAKKINFEHTRITARARALTLITDLRCFVKKIEKELNASDKNETMAVVSSDCAIIADKAADIIQTLNNITEIKRSSNHTYWSALHRI